MHSRIFVLTDNLNEVDNITYPDEVEMANSIGADSIVEEGEQEFKDSVEWLKGCYNLKNVNFRQTPSEFGSILVAEIDKKELVEAAEKEIDKRIEAVKEALEKRDLWKVAWEAYNQRGFYFYADGYSLMNIVDLHNYAKDFGNKLYVIRTYDYHF